MLSELELSDLRKLREATDAAITAVMAELKRSEWRFVQVATQW